MGQAKLRGTFEQRKQKAIVETQKRLEAVEAVSQDKKHKRLSAYAVAALSAYKLGKH